MPVSVELPDEIARQLRLDGEQGTRRALEMLALAGYRAAELSRGQVSELLGQSFYETEEFLKRNHAEIKLTMEEYERSAEALERLLRR